MKNLFLVLAVWIMFTNGQIWKYPQADEFLFGSGHDYVPWQDKKFYLCNAMSGVTIVALPQYQCKEIGFSISKPKSYHVFKNPIYNTNSADMDYNVQIINGVRRAIKDLK